MAMFINYKDNKCIKQQIGEYINECCVEVASIQADGNELKLIRLKFEGIRKTNFDICVWTGDDAKFIVSNWNFLVGGR